MSPVLLQDEVYRPPGPKKAKTVLISGAGIAGATLAYWLAHYGFIPTLIERAPALRTGSYVVDFWGAGFDVAERMDLVPALRRDGYRVRGAHRRCFGRTRRRVRRGGVSPSAARPIP